MIMGDTLLPKSDGFNIISIVDGCGSLWVSGSYPNRRRRGECLNIPITIELVAAKLSGNRPQHSPAEP